MSICNIFHKVQADMCRFY